MRYICTRAAVWADCGCVRTMQSVQSRWWWRRWERKLISRVRVCLPEITRICNITHARSHTRAII